MAASMLNGKAQAGFTYLGVLMLVAVLGIGLAATGQVWSSVARRDKERELLWVGAQYAQALRSYYRSSPGLAQYPAALDDLVEDDRFPQPRRHLRKRYPDPITNSSEWGLMRGLDGRITGIYSLSHDVPLKQAGFDAQWSDFEGLGHYSDWQFVAEKAFAESAGARRPGSRP